MRLDGKIALVTGAAQGHGAAIARLFASEGAMVFVTDVTEERCTDTISVIAGSGKRAVPLELDVTVPEHWIRAVDAIESRDGRLDILVNNAGISLTASIEDTSYEQWQSLLRINLDSAFLGCKTCMGLMKRTGGSIINMSSILGLIGSPDFAAYCASKGGIRLLTKSVALHCARKRYGIRVNSIHPGFMKTPMGDAYLDEFEDRDAARRDLEALIPLGHLGSTTDVAEAALYLASDAASFITGSELVIDGGLTAR